MQMYGIDSVLLSLESSSGLNIIGAHKSPLNVVELHQNIGVQPNTRMASVRHPSVVMNLGVLHLVNEILKGLGWGTGFKEAQLIWRLIFRSDPRDRYLFLLQSTKTRGHEGIKSAATCAESSTCVFLHTGQELILLMSSALFFPLE